MAHFVDGQTPRIVNDPLHLNDADGLDFDSKVDFLRFIARFSVPNTELENTHQADKVMVWAVLRDRCDAAVSQQGAGGSETKRLLQLLAICRNQDGLQKFYNDLRDQPVVRRLEFGDLDETSPVSNSMHLSTWFFSASLAGFLLASIIQYSQGVSGLHLVASGLATGFLTGLFVCILRLVFYSVGRCLTMNGHQLSAIPSACLGSLGRCDAVSNAMSVSRAFEGSYAQIDADP